MGDRTINGASKTRVRCANFTESETERLIRLVEANSVIILDKRTDKGASKEKDRVWDAITVEFNSQTGINEFPRTTLQLRAKLANMRKRLQESLNQSETTSDCGDPFEDQSSSTANDQFNGDAEIANGNPAAPTKLEFVPIAPRPAAAAAPQLRILQPSAAPAQLRIVGVPREPAPAADDADELAARRRHAAELRRQELRHREELHALRVTHARALHELRVREARLRVRLVRRKLADAKSEPEDERSDTED